jgi:hypothetical protein
MSVLMGFQRSEASFLAKTKFMGTKSSIPLTFFKQPLTSKLFYLFVNLGYMNM